MIIFYLLENDNLMIQVVILLSLFQARLSRLSSASTGVPHLPKNLCQSQKTCQSICQSQKSCQSFKNCFCQFYSQEKKPSYDHIKLVLLHYYFLLSNFSSDNWRPSSNDTHATSPKRNFNNNVGPHVFYAIAFAIAIYANSTWRSFVPGNLDRPDHLSIRRGHLETIVGFSLYGSNCNYFEAVLRSHLRQLGLPGLIRRTITFRSWNMPAPSTTNN